MKNDTQSNLSISVVTECYYESQVRVQSSSLFKSNKNVDFHFGTQGQEAEEEGRYQLSASKKH